MNQKKKTGIAALATLMALALALTLVPTGSSAQVEPRFIEGGPGTNFTCDDFEPDDTDWNQLKVDPPRDGVYPDDDQNPGPLVVTLDMQSEDRFDWSSNIPVDAVFVKGGRNGHNLYLYDPPVTSDDDLRIPNADKNAISHISFCYEEREPPEPPELLCPTNLRAVVDGEDIVVGFDPAEGSDGTNVYRSAGDADAVLVAELGPDATRYRDTDVTVGVTYTYEVRAVYGEEESEPCPTVQQRIPPPEPEPEPECPAVDLQATANQDGSITVNVATNASFELMRSGGGETVSLGTFEGDSQVVDTNTTVGTTYTYTVMVGELDCGSIQVTAIPVFPTVAAMGLALTASLLGYAGLRRRS